MKNKKENRNGKTFKSDAVIYELLKNPMRSLKDMAKACNFGKQRFWNHKKKLEKDNTIWGYTAVIDESKIGWKLFIVLFKEKPLTTRHAEKLIERAESHTASEDIRLIDAFYTSGEYDWITVFAAKDWSTARKYYDTLRVLYEDRYEEKPKLLDVMFTMYRSGKANPEKDRIKDFVPKGL